jgi:hypothetical protein
MLLANHCENIRRMVAGGQHLLCFYPDRLARGAQKHFADRLADVLLMAAVSWRGQRSYGSLSGPRLNLSMRRRCLQVRIWHQLNASVVRPVLAVVVRTAPPLAHCIG